MGIAPFELLIIGAGPAGLSAGIYGARMGLKTLILEKGISGGTMTLTHVIENYPGFPDGISGGQLGKLMFDQCQRFGVEFMTDEAKRIENVDDIFKIQTEHGSYISKSIIIASGVSPRRLNVPGESELLGRGVSYCAICDGPFFRGLDVAIIGCGNSGLQEGQYLMNYAKSITFVEFLPQITADKILYDYFQSRENVYFRLNSEVISINGHQKVESLIIRDRKTGAKVKINIAGVFIYVGLLPNAQFIQGFLQTDINGFIVTDENMETSVKGIFAAGDVRSKRVRQVVVACSEGARAAISVYHYLSEQKKLF